MDFFEELVKMLQHMPRVIEYSIYTDGKWSYYTGNGKAGATGCSTPITGLRIVVAPSTK